MQFQLLHYPFNHQNQTTNKCITKMTKNPYFPFYPQDFLTGVKMFTPAETGAYILLLIEQWDRGFITKDDRFLKKITTFSSKKLQKVLEKFTSSADGTCRNLKLEKIRAEVNRKNDLQRGRAIKRWGKIDDEAVGKVDAAALPRHYRGNANQNQNQNQSQTITKVIGVRGFDKPTKNQVQNFMEEIGVPQTDATAEAEKFWNHYEANGWLVGKSKAKMKDWNAAVRKWKSNISEFKNYAKHNHNYTGESTSAIEKIGRVPKSELENFVGRKSSPGSQ